MYEIRFVYDEYVKRNEIENAQEWTTPTIDEWRLEIETKMTTTYVTNSKSKMDIPLRKS